MIRFVLILGATLAVDLVAAAPGWAQIETGQCKVYEAAGSQIERLEGVDRFYGSTEQAVRIDCDDQQFFADYMEILQEKDLLIARGHVVFVSRGTRIAADRMEFNTRSRTGTFYDAYGSTALGDRAERSMFGTQEPDAYFWGAELKKLGERKYRITRGGFTTCVQATPRWDIVSGSITVNLDDYAILTNSVFRVKGVPLMYLPIVYYPVQEDDRATGFLIPTYGGSNVKGQVISNAFFWAIGRSHDATVFHDWLSKAGQQVGGEYRYVLGPASNGTTRFSLLNERETAMGPGDTGAVRPARRSFSFGGNLAQKLPGTFRATGSADYFSSIETQQQYQQDLYRATNRTRSVRGHVTGTLGQYALSAALDRNDVFFSATTHVTTGSLPRVNLSRPERPIPGTPLYFGVNSEYAALVRSTTNSGVKEQDQGLTRMDVTPVIRVPFSRWPFLGINSQIAWRGTYWTERLDEGVQVPDPIGRQYFDLQTRITGPVFTRIFNTPDNAYAERFKHVIEPALAVQRLTAIDQFDRIVKLDGTDWIVGNDTRYTYGLTNRLYAKKEVAREIASVTISQTYHTDATASQYDRQYQSSFSVRTASNFTPVALQARTSPTDRLRAELRAEWDHTVRAIRTISASGSFSEGAWLNASAGWSQRRFIADLPGFDDPNRADQYLNASVDLRGLRNRIGGTYSFHYDLLRDRFLEQRWVTYYNAQCCGIALEYQTFNLQGAFVVPGVAQDHRFNISFTLAGVGTFSNLFGAFGGPQGRR